MLNLSSLSQSKNFWSCWLWCGFGVGAGGVGGGGSGGVDGGGEVLKSA